MSLYESILQNLKEDSSHGTSKPSKDLLDLVDRFSSMFNIDMSGAKFISGLSEYEMSKKFGDYEIGVSPGSAWHEGCLDTLTIVYKNQEPFPEDWNDFKQRVKDIDDCSQYLDNYFTIELSDESYDLVKDMINKVKNSK